MSRTKNTPFPGMDPYLERPSLWEGVHTRLVVAIADRLQPLLDPRYIASVEERVFLEGRKHRYPDVRVEERKRKATRRGGSVAVLAPRSAAATVVELDVSEVKQRRIEVLDRQQEMKLVTAIEVVSPSNKAAGPGRRSYQSKQAEFLERDCHFVEIDLLRKGKSVVAVPEWRARRETPDYDYLTCVSRWPDRRKFELYMTRLEEPLPEISVPLVAPDEDVLLSLQEVVEKVWNDNRTWWRIRYEEPCVPRLTRERQQWAAARWNEWKQSHPELIQES